MLKWMIPIIILLGSGCGHEGRSSLQQVQRPLTPVVASDWFRIAEHPDRHLNDFCVFRDREGIWHAMGIMGTGSWRSEQSLFHCVGKNLQSRFEWREPILQDNPPPPLAPQKHAPYVVYHAGRYHLFYRRPPGTTLRLQSADPNRWVGLGEEVFAENDARDVFIIRIGGIFHMYYCQLTEIDWVNRSCILLRRSRDLVTWGDAEVVHVDTARPAEHSYLESPFVVQRPEGFYLFIRHRNYRKADVVTVVLFSNRADRFPSGTRQWFAELHGVHAPEIVIDGGRYYIFRVSGARHASVTAPEKGGWIEVAELQFEKRNYESRVSR